MLTHANLERGAAQRQRIVESFFHFDVEPGVDAAIDKLQRKIEHDNQWNYRKTDEHRDDAGLESRAGYPLPVIPDQPPDMTGKQQHQCEHAGGVDHQQHVVQTIEFAGILRSL